MDHKPRTAFEHALPESTWNRDDGPTLWEELEATFGRPPARQPRRREIPAEGWRWHVESARQIWARLTYNELLKSGGDRVILARLIEDRYALTHQQAEQQVGDFLGRLSLTSATQSA